MRKTSFLRPCIAICAAAALISSFAATKDATQLYESATKEFDSNRFESALTLYLKADSAFVAEGKSETPEYAQSLHSTGRACFNTDDIANGREYTRQAMQLRERLFGKVSKEHITSLNNYALSYFMDGNYDTALKHISEAVELCRQMNPPHPDEGMYLINLGRICNAMKDQTNAILYMEEALPKVEKFSQNYEFILNFLGNAYMETEDNANINRILGLMDEHNRHELEKECNDPECHLQRAEYYYTIGDPAHAKDEYMAVFAMQLSDSQKAEACRHYAQFLTNQGDYALAGDYYAMAADALDNANGGASEGSVSLRKQAGLCYFVGREYDKAIASHGRVISDVDRYGFPEKHKSTSLQGLGNAYSAKKDYDNSISAFKQWIKHLETHGHQAEADFAKAYERLAASEKFKGDYDASIADYEKAIGLYDSLGMHDERQQASDGLKMCLFYAHKDMGESEENVKARQQRADKTREIIRSSLNSLEQSGDYLGRLSTARTYATLAGSYAQLEEYADAIDWYEKYMDAIRPALAEAFILKNAKERELTWRQELDNISEMSSMISELPQETPELYARLSRLIYDGQLLSKGILLSSNVEFDKILNRYGTKEMKSRYDAIKSNLAEIDRMKQQHKPAEEILKLTRDTDAMQLALARESAKFGIYTDFLNISTSDIYKALAQDDAAVEFVTLPTGLLHGDNLVAAVLVSKEFPTGLTIPVATVEQIKSIIDDKDKFSNDEYARALWGGIMQAAPGKKRIFFSPDGILNNIGIEYLTMDGKPMSEIIEMHRLSSTREIAREHVAKPISYAALFGDIDYIDYKYAEKKKYEPLHTDGPEFSNLEFTEKEVSEIGSLLKEKIRKSDVKSYEKDEAGLSEFLSQGNAPVNLLHIATHGMYTDKKGASDSDAMSRSILALSGASRYKEGVVTAADIAEMTLQDCELAVLSACESGLGKLGDDGVFGLQRGFKNAGVKSLLVSLNEVADASTADMMIVFYRNLFDGSGMSRREALRKAQAEIRAAYPSDPTWASFILIDSFN